MKLATFEVPTKVGPVRRIGAVVGAGDDRLVDFTAACARMLADRGDGRAGAKTHSHPEEQIFIPLRGKMKIRCENEWFTVEPGDVFLMPANTEHEEICDEEFLWLNIKNRIPGHSWYDTTWVPGAEDEWKKVKAILDEMDRKYKEKTPWNK